MGGKGSGRKKETAHDKRKRLLTVVPKKRGFRCYGCGRSGNELHIQLQVVCLTGVVSKITPEGCCMLCRGCIDIWNMQYSEDRQAVIIKEDGYYLAEEPDLGIKEGRLTNAFKRRVKRAIANSHKIST